ncbi:PQQ-binding-like beta-propeller repeat protein [Streptomyces sp. NBC_01174]|uniref:outer membrane protein assembly factor BamB family protein n=1 Tax=Streptomyces sp. NBC_01174 TaxID=2903758 RepID=UPI002F91A249|nr:PQQ-binding-like beta-propeller repeat protein [Streptomyces sp. NBC_01174]
MSHPPMPPVPPAAPGPPPQGPPGFGPAPYAGGPYGAPPPYGPIPPSGGPGRGGKRGTAVIAACVTAALAVVAAGTLAVLHVSDGQRSAADGKGNAPASASPAAPSTQGRVLLNVPQPPQPDRVQDEGYRADGAWVTPHSYASGGPDSILGYDLDSGKQTWKLPLDGNLCRASKEVTSQGYVAVVFAGSKKDWSKCSEIAVIDINQGRKLWQKSLPDAHRGLSMSVAVSEELAAVSWPDEESWGLAIDTGKTVWDSHAPGCGYEEFIGGRTLTSLALCTDHFAVSQRDPRTGKASRIAKLPNNLGYPYLASAEPLVVASYIGDEDNWLDANRLTTFTADGSVKKTIKVDDYILGCTDDIGTGCGALVATQDTLYLSSRREHITSGSHVTALDTATGRIKWTADLDGEGMSELRPLRADKGDLIAYNVAGAATEGSGVYRFAAADGQETVLLEEPADFEISEATSQIATPKIRQPVIYEDGRLFFHLGDGLGGGAPLNFALTTH